MELSKKDILILLAILVLPLIIYVSTVSNVANAAAVMTEVPVVGAVSTSTAKVQVRTSAAASVVVEYDTNSNFSSPTATASQSTVSGDDFTTTFSISGLTADTRYYYRVKVDGVVNDPGFTQRFNTFPSSGMCEVSLFADVANNDRDANVYSNAAGSLFAIQLGDLDHGNPSSLSASRTMHRDQRDTSNLHGSDFAKRILSKRGLVHIWDDHDYCGNDEDRFCSSRADAWQAFDEYYPTYNRPNADNGLWHSFTCSDAEFFVLDLRSQRDAGTDTDNSSKSMLDGALISDDQKDWFLEGLRDSSATWKIIVSSVTFNEDSRPSSIDLWHSYSTEAGEIKDWIEGTGHAHSAIDGVMVVSGDIHTGGGIDDGTNSLIGVPEMTVPHTNLAGGNRNNLGTWSEGVTKGKPNGSGYSTLEVSSSSVIMKAYDASGTQRHSYTVN